jgi:hypothetical protein
MPLIIRDMCAYDVRYGQGQGQEEDSVDNILEVLFFEVDVGNEDIVIKIKEAEQDGIGDGVLDEDPGQGKKGLARGSDGRECRDHKKEGDKEYVCEPASLFLIVLHSIRSYPPKVAIICASWSSLG